MTVSLPKDSFSSSGKYYSPCFLFVLLTLASIAASAETPFKQCTGFTNTYLNITSISFDHDPTEGKDLKITLSGTAAQPTSISQLELQMFQGNIQIQDDKKSVTLSFEQSAPATIDYVYSVPGVVPSGTYTGKILMMDSAKTELVCYSFDMIFSDPSNASQLRDSPQVPT